VLELGKRLKAVVFEDHVVMGLDSDARCVISGVQYRNEGVAALVVEAQRYICGVFAHLRASAQQ